MTGAGHTGPAAPAYFTFPRGSGTVGAPFNCDTPPDHLVTPPEMAGWTAYGLTPGGAAPGGFAFIQVSAGEGPSVARSFPLQQPSVASVFVPRPPGHDEIISLRAWRVFVKEPKGYQDLPVGSNRPLCPGY